MSYRTLPFEVKDFISCFDFEWHGLNEVGNTVLPFLYFGA